MRDIIRSIFIFIYILMMMTSLMPITILSQNISFELKDVSFTNSAGYTEVYPGSNNARLRIYVLYTGSDKISSVSACLINVPSGFQPLNRCSGSNNMNNTFQQIVSPGDMLYFSYVLDISKNVAPGPYSMGLNITYTVTSTNAVGSYILYFAVMISQYPSLNLSIKDAYLSPISYPGTTSSTLYIIVENDGNSDISSGEAKIFLPQGFVAADNIINLPSIPRGSRATLMLQNIGVEPWISPGIYQYYINIDALATTSDGVSYEATQILTGYVQVNPSPSINLEIISMGWSSPLAPIDTLNAEYRIILRNKDLSTINNVVAILSLPECMSSLNNSRTVIYTLTNPVNPGSLFEIDFSNIKIFSQCLLNTYFSNLTLNIYASLKGSEFYTTVSYMIPMVITNSSLDIRVGDVYWSKAPVYPGSINNQLVIIVDNRDYMDLRSVVARLSSKDLYPSETTVFIQGISSGSRAQINIQVSIPQNVSPGDHVGILMLNYVASYSSTSFLGSNILQITYRIDKAPKPLIELIYYGWIDTEAYNGSVGNRLRIIIRNGDILPINSFIAELDVSSCCKIYDRDRYVVSGNRLDPGSDVELIFDHIDIPNETAPGTYFLRLNISGLAGFQNSEFWFNIIYNISIEIKRPSLYIELLDYGWSRTSVYQNTSRASIYVILRSYSKDIISQIIASLELINTISSTGSRYVVSTTTSNINYGDSVRISFDNIEINTSVLDAKLHIKATLTSGSVRYLAEKNFDLKINTVKEKILEISYVQTLYQGNPAPLLASARDVVLRIGFVNRLPEPISSVSPSIETPDLIIVRGVGGTCLSGVGGGGSCYIDLYLDVSEKIQPGTQKINISLDIYKNVEGSSVSIAREMFTIPIVVEDPMKYSGAPEIISVYWGTTSPTPVFNYSRYVPMTIRVMNVGRYPIYGVSVSVESENLVPVRNSDTCSATLQVGGYCSATLYFDINTSLNEILLKIIIRYISNEYGSYVILSKTFYVTTRLENISIRDYMRSSVEYITSMWLEGSVEPFSLGVHLMIIFRNNFVENIKGPYLILRLPDGFTSSIDNSSVLRLVPTQMNIQQIQGLISQNILSTAQISNILGSLPTVSSSQTYSKGDFIIFVAQINIFNVSLGIYKAYGELIYTDDLGVLRVEPVEIVMPVIGSTKYIDVQISSPLIMNQSRGHMMINLINRGSAPIYNVYLSVAPMATPLVIASPSVYYIDKIDPGVVNRIIFNISYNPYTSYQTEIKYGTVPLTISIIYRDPSGSIKTFNTTYAVIVEPFIELILRDVSARYREGFGVEFSGTLINMGSVTAQRVEVEACIENRCESTVVGDIDPGTQSAFRLEIKIPGVRNNTLLAQIRYYDSYNRLQKIEYNISIQIITLTETQTQTKSWIESLDIYKIIIGGIVIILATTFLYMIYRSVSRKMQS